MTDKDDIKKWLIDNKFEDTPEGLAKLAKSYTELQGRTQKAEDANKENAEALLRLKPLEKIGQFLSRDEASLQFIKRRMAVGSKEQELKEPEMPADYDSLDTGTTGTATYKYHQDLRKYDIAMAKQEVKTEFDSELSKIRAEISDSGKESRATEDLHKALAKSGYDDEGITEFEKFVKELKPEKATETLIKLHKLETGKDVVVPLSELQLLNDKGFPLAPIIPGIVERESEPDEAAKKEMEDALKVG